MRKMQFALAFSIIVLCLIPFLIGAGFGLDALLKYKSSTDASPEKRLKSNRRNSLSTIQPQTINLTTGQDRQTIRASVRYSQLPSALTLEDFNNAIFKFQTRLIEEIINILKVAIESLLDSDSLTIKEQTDWNNCSISNEIEADNSRETSVISPLASTVTLLFMIFAAGEDSKKKLCTAAELRREYFTLPLNTSSVTAVGSKFLIDTLKPRVKLTGRYSINIDSGCHIRDQIRKTMTDLGVDVKKVPRIPFGPTVKSSTSMNFNIRVKQFSYVCTKGSGKETNIVATARRGKLPSLDNAEFFELLPSSENSGMGDDKLIIIRPSSEESDNIQSVKSKFSRLEFDNFLYFTKDKVKLSLLLSDVNSIHSTREIFPVSMISAKSFDMQGNLIGAYYDLCDDNSNKVQYTANYDQEIKFEIKTTGVPTCPNGTTGGLEEVKIDNKFIMLLLNKKNIVSTTIVDN